MSFPRYPAYKDSGVEWLGEVPKHWHGPTKLGEISSLKGRLGWQGLKAEEYSDAGPFVVSSAHFSNFKIRWDDCPHVSRERYELDDNIQLSLGDILLMKDGAALGKLALVDELPGDACLNSHLLLFRPLQKGLDLSYWPKFAFYYLQTTLFQEYMQTRGTGATFMGVSQDTIFRHQVLWPSSGEQLLIAAFLDHETNKIDALIEEQKRLIELLKEKRQAVISQAVTKGLDPSVPMTDSGVEWIGTVPAHWRVGALGYLASIDSGATPDRSNPDYWNGDIPWIKTGEVNYAPIFEAEEHITEAGLAGSSTRIAEPGTLLMAMYGQGVTRGRVAMLAVAAAYNQACAAIRFGPDVLADFARYYFIAAYEHVRDSGNQTSQMNLSTGAISKFKLPVPPLDEQRQIVARLDGEHARLDGLLDQSALALLVLAERRSALISAAVTGKIDVRHYQAEVA